VRVLLLRLQASVSYAGRVFDNLKRRAILRKIMEHFYQLRAHCGWLIA